MEEEKGRKMMNIGFLLCVSGFITVVILWAFQHFIDNEMIVTIVSVLVAISTVIGGLIGAHGTNMYFDAQREKIQ